MKPANMPERQNERRRRAIERFKATKPIPKEGRDVFAERQKLVEETQSRIVEGALNVRSKKSRTGRARII